MRSLNIAATGMHAQQLYVDVISNNIANINTTAYKRQRAEFEDLLYQDEMRAGTNSTSTETIVPAGIQIGLGVSTGAVYRIHQQGELTQTGSQYDVAIRGKGYFKVQMPDGTPSYTRAGAFQLSPDGEIVTQQGYIIEPGITIPDDAVSVTITDSGLVQVQLQGQPDPVDVGQLELSTFINDTGLQAIGDNLYLATTASGEEITNIPGENSTGLLLQGYLETSNVDPVTEITNLITAQRGYEMNSKVIESANQMMQAVNQMV